GLHSLGHLAEIADCLLAIADWNRPSEIGNRQFFSLPFIELQVLRLNKQHQHMLDTIDRRRGLDYDLVPGRVGVSFDVLNYAHQQALWVYPVEARGNDRFTDFH